MNSYQKLIDCFSWENYLNLGEKETKPIVELLNKEFPDINLTGDYRWIQLCKSVYFYFTKKDLQIDSSNKNISDCKKEVSLKVIELLREKESMLSSHPENENSSYEDEQKEDVAVNLKKNKQNNIVSPEYFSNSQEKDGKYVTDSSSNDGYLASIKTPERVGSIEYGSGLTLNLGAMHSSRFYTSISVPSNWENREIAFSLSKDFCDSRIKEEYKAIGNFPVEHEIDNDRFVRLSDSFYEISESCVHKVSYSLSKTIPMENYESAKFHLSISVYCKANDIDKMYSQIRKWVNYKIQHVAKEVMQKADKFIERRKKQPF